VRRLGIPRLPKSIVLVTLSQAIRQLSPLASFLPLDKKNHSDFVNGFDNPFRNIESNKQVNWDGREDRFN
jgi:hypothetical protein